LRQMAVGSIFLRVLGKEWQHAEHMRQVLREQKGTGDRLLNAEKV
jgi:hypothetical protein